MEVPKIILQPIVENAIYHGIRELDHPGKVWITAKREADILILDVRDNGVGFSQTTERQDNSKVRLGGVGLDNVNQRLKLYYGEAYGLAIHSELGTGTTVTLKLPYRFLAVKVDDHLEGDLS